MNSVQLTKAAYDHEEYCRKVSYDVGISCVYKDEVFLSQRKLLLNKHHHHQLSSPLFHNHLLIKLPLKTYLPRSS